MPALAAVSATEVNAICAACPARPTERQEPQTLDPVQSDEGEAAGRRWTFWLVVFLRTMAAVSLVKGLYHWAIVCGINAPSPSGFDSYPTPYQVATVFFAVIDLVAGVGLWLAAPWGAVVWLPAVISWRRWRCCFPKSTGATW